MPKTELHTRQRIKNWTFFAILLALAMLFFALTVVRMGMPAA